MTERYSSHLYTFSSKCSTHLQTFLLLVTVMEVISWKHRRWGHYGGTGNMAPSSPKAVNFPPVLVLPTEEMRCHCSAQAVYQQTVIFILIWTQSLKRSWILLDQSSILILRERHKIAPGTMFIITRGQSEILPHIQCYTMSRYTVKWKNIKKNCTNRLR